VGVIAALGQLYTHDRVVAQQIQTRLPALQDPVSDSLETQILARLSMGQSQPDDLPRLARMTVLESIWILSNVQNDLRDTSAGVRVEQQIATFWDAAQVLSEDISSSPLDMTTLSRAQAESGDMVAAYRQMEATLGELPGFSDRAATHMQDITRLINAMSSVMGTMEGNLLSTVPPPTNRSVNLESMREQAQLLANDLVVLIGSVKDSQRGRAASDGMLEDLNGTLTAVQDFIRLLPLEPSFNDLQKSFRVARRRMWHAEAGITQLEWPPELKRRWRGVRERFNAISDDFGLPRVAVATPRVARVAGSNHKLVAQVDRSIAWVDEFRAEQGRELRKTPAGTRFEGDVLKMRRQLIELRRRAIANESTERLSQALREIELMNHQLGGRVDDLDRARRDDIAARFRGPAQAVDSLRGIIAHQ